MVIFQNLSKNGEMLKNVGENIKKNLALIFFYNLYKCTSDFWRSLLKLVPGKLVKEIECHISN